MILPTSHRLNMSIWCRVMSPVKGPSHHILLKLVQLCWYRNLFQFFQVLQLLKFYWLTGSGKLRRTTLSNFVEIRQTVAEILRFFDSATWRPSRSWGLEFVEFYWLIGSGDLRRIIVSSKSLNPLRICDYYRRQPVAILDLFCRPIWITPKEYFAFSVTV